MPAPACQWIGHAEILAGRPQRIPPRVVEMLEPRRVMLGSASMTMPRWPFFTARSRFLRRRFDAAQVGNDRERHVAIAHLAPLGQRRRCRPARSASSNSASPWKNVRALHRIVGEQHLAVDAVAIQRLEALGRVVDDRRHLVPALRKGLAQRVAHHRRTVHRAALADHLAVHEPALDRLVGGANHVLLVGRFAQLRNLVAEFRLRHAAGPRVFVQLRVRIATDQPVLDLHGLALLFS